MTTAPRSARSTLTKLLPAPMPPVNPTRMASSESSGVAERGDVDVVLVVGGVAPPRLHRAPTVTAALRRPDVLLPNNLADSELTPVLPGHVGDGSADLQILRHDVERTTLAVLAAPTQTAVAGDL